MPAELHGLFRSDDWGRTWTRLGREAIADAVNALVLSPEFPMKPDALVMLGDALFISRDGGGSWSDWRASVDLEQGTASVVAPLGLDPGAPLLLGLVEGGVVRT